MNFFLPALKNSFVIGGNGDAGQKWKNLKDLYYYLKCSFYRHSSQELIWNVSPLKHNPICYVCCVFQCLYISN